MRESNLAGTPPHVAGNSEKSHNWPKNCLVAQRLEDSQSEAGQTVVGFFVFVFVSFFSFFFYSYLVVLWSYKNLRLIDLEPTIPLLNPVMPRPGENRENETYLIGCLGSLGVSSTGLDFISELERAGKTKPVSSAALEHWVCLQQERIFFSGLERTEIKETYLIDVCTSLDSGCVWILYWAPWHCLEQAHWWLPLSAR